MPTLREKLIEAIDPFSYYTTGIADAVLALLDGPVVEIPEYPLDCMHWGHGMGQDLCNLTGKECNADNCPGSGKYRLVRCD